jgi:hypothetical protein
VFLGAVRLSDPISLTAGQESEKQVLKGVLAKIGGLRLAGDLCLTAKSALN